MILKKVKVSRLVSFAVLLLGAAIMLIPFIWMVLTSFKTFAETVKLPIVWLPSSWKLDNYTYILDKMTFLLYYRNTFIMTTLVVIGQLFICSLAAYAFARLRFPGQGLIFASLLLVLMVPGQMTMIPRYLMVERFRWTDTFMGLILPLVPSAYSTFLLRQFFMTLPKDLEEAARIDGCSYFRTYWNILLPLCTSSLIACGILTFMDIWNGLLWPLIVCNTEKMRVLSVALSAMQGGQYGTRYQYLMAASVLATLPTILVFIVGQKYFIQGIALSGIKG